MDELSIGVHESFIGAHKCAGIVHKSEVRVSQAAIRADESLVEEHTMTIWEGSVANGAREVTAAEEESTTNVRLTDCHARPSLMCRSARETITLNDCQP